LRGAAAEGGAAFDRLDAFAALATDGGLLVSLVNCRPDGPLRVEIDLGSFTAGDAAQLRLLSGRSPADGNTLEAREAVRPVDRSIAVRAGRVELELPVFTVARLRVPGR
jgi:alpha-L-arabinofuranosidase